MPNVTEASEEGTEDGLGGRRDDECCRLHCIVVGARVGSEEDSSHGKNRVSSVCEFVGVCHKVRSAGAGT